MLGGGDDEDEEDEEEAYRQTSDDEYFASLHGKKYEAFDAEKEREKEMADPDPAEFPVEGEGEEFIKNLKDAISGNELTGTGEISKILENAAEAETEEPGETEDSEAAAEEVKEPEAPKAVPDEDDPVPTDGLPDVQAALEAALEGRQISYTNNVKHPGVTETEMPKLKTGEIELAIPIRSAEEFMEQAAANGDQPSVREDQLTGVKFVDYSDCL